VILREEREKNRRVEFGSISCVVACEWVAERCGPVGLLDEAMRCVLSSQRFMLFRVVLCFLLCGHFMFKGDAFCKGRI